MLLIDYGFLVILFFRFLGFSSVGYLKYCIFIKLKMWILYFLYLLHLVITKFRKKRNFKDVLWLLYQELRKRQYEIFLLILFYYVEYLRKTIILEDKTIFPPYLKVEIHVLVKQNQIPMFQSIELSRIKNNYLLALEKVHFKDEIDLKDDLDEKLKNLLEKPIEFFPSHDDLIDDDLILIH